MKKNFYSLLALLFATAAITSCNPDEKLPPAPKADATPAENKEYMEDVAVELAEELKAENFKNVFELATYLASEYSSENYDYDGFEDWSEECFEAITKTTSPMEQKGDEYYRTITELYKASSFTGKFEAKNGKWKVTESDHIEICVKDQNDNPCVFTLTTSGAKKAKTVSYEYDEERVYNEREIETSWGYTYTNYEPTDTIEIFVAEVEIPEEIKVSLTQNGEELASATLKTDLSSMEGDEIDLQKDQYNISLESKFNGYSIIVDKIKYSNDGTSEFAVSFKHDKKTIFEASLSADIDASNEDIYECVNMNVNINLLNRIQIKGTCADMLKLEKYMNEAEDEDDNKPAFNKYVNKINDLIDIQLYYNKSKDASAYLEFETAKMEDDYYDYYYLSPVIVFNDEDNSRYSTDEFFGEDEFELAMEAFDKLVYDFEYYLEKLSDEIY